MEQNLVKVTIFFLVEVDSNGGTRVEESLVSLSRILLQLYDILPTQNRLLDSSWVFNLFWNLLPVCIYDYAMGTLEQEINKSLPMSKVSLVKFDYSVVGVL